MNESILVVEDDDTLRGAVVYWLKREGLQVDTATNTQGIRAARPPDAKSGARMHEGGDPRASMGGHVFPADPRTVDVHVRWLRRKLGDDPGNPTLIETVRGVGYRCADERAPERQES